MKVRKFILLAVVAGLVALNGSFSQADAKTEWLKEAQLGQFAPAKQDWNAIEAAARKEGKVVIYSVSSRIFKIQKEFKEKYGVEIVCYDMTSDEQVEKFGREHKADVHNVDVLFNNATSVLIGDLLPKKMIWNFVPDSVAPLLDDNEKDPFLVQRWSCRVFIYNTARNPGGPPVDNLWDLTRKEWKGKVLTPELTDPATANTYQTILGHPEEMAAAYKKEFGKPVQLSSDMKNAAEEWMLRYMKNAVIVPSTTKIFKGVSDVKQDRPHIGLTTFSKLRDVKKVVYESAALVDMEPVFGISYPTVLVIADQAPHPNAAKLLVKYMMGDGLWPWNVIGDYAARKDLEEEQVKKFKIPPYSKAKLWAADPKHIFKTQYDYLQFTMSIGK